MSSSGRETLSDVREWWEAFPNVQQWSGDLPDVQVWSGRPLGCPGMVGSPSRMSGSGREANLNVWE